MCKGRWFGDSRTGGIAALPGGFEPAPEHAGLYDHGSYPFVLDPLFPVEGSPCGYGFVDLCHNNQTAIDLMRTAIIKNTVVGATPRYFQRIDGSVNEEEFADLGRALVHVSGNLGEDSLRQIGFSPLSGVYMDVLNSSIQELREKLDELQKYKALALAFARRYRPDMAEGLTGEPAASDEPAAAQPAAPSEPAAAGDGGAALPPPYMP